MSGLALLLVLPAMLLATSYFKVIELGGEAATIQIVADKVNYAGRDVERVIKYWLQQGTSVDNYLLNKLAENYRAATGLLVNIKGIDSDHDNQVDTADVVVSDPRSAANYSSRLEFTKLSVAVYSDKPTYRPGDNVTLTVYVGTIYGTPVAEANVILVVIDSTGDNAYVASGLTDSQGKWENSFILSESADLGTYLATAKATKNSMTGAGNTTFDVKHALNIRIITPLAGASYLPNSIVSIKAKLTDEDGNNVLGAYAEFEILNENYITVAGPTTMYDDTTNPDYIANNAIYGKSTTMPSSTGIYYVRIYARKEGYSDNFADRQITIGGQQAG
jgi:hypothetical protein